MAARNLEVRRDGEVEHFTSMREAVLAFGRSLTGPYQRVTLVENMLDGPAVIADSIIEANAPGEHSVCPVCGVRHEAGQHHGYETTGARLLMQHEHGNHSQCHPGSGCKRSGGRESEGVG